MHAVTSSKRLLDPLDRAAEILFGLIMALTFTCSIGFATRGETEIRDLLIGAISSNLAWGIVDASMYLIGVLANKSRTKTIFESSHDSAQTAKAKRYIAEMLSPTAVSTIGKQGIEDIRSKIASLSNSPGEVKLTGRDFKEAVAVFFVIFISTFPVVVPFVLIRDATLALRISNLIAITMMFLCGWSVAKYVGYNKWKMSIAITLIGIILVLITICLGG